MFWQGDRINFQKMEQYGIHIGGNMTPVPVEMSAVITINTDEHNSNSHRDERLLASAANRSIGSTTGCTITEKAPTRIRF